MTKLSELGMAVDELVAAGYGDKDVIVVVREGNFCRRIPITRIDVEHGPFGATIEIETERER